MTWFVIAVIVIIGLVASGILTIHVEIVKKKGQRKRDLDDDDKDGDDGDDGDNELEY